MIVVFLDHTHIYITTSTVFSIHCVIEHVRDTDSNKFSADFFSESLLYNALCYYYCVALYLYICMYCTNEIKF